MHVFEKSVEFSQLRFFSLKPKAHMESKNAGEAIVRINLFYEVEKDVSYGSDIAK